MSASICSRNFLIPWNIHRMLSRRTSKIAVEVTSDVQRLLENAEIKAQHHPGRCKTGNITTPSYVIRGVTRAVGDYPLKTLHREAEILKKYLQSRHPPPENKEIQQKVAKIQNEIEADDQTANVDLSETQLENLQRKTDQKITRILKQRTFAWRPMTYGHYESLLYVLSRGSLEYTVLSKILKEILERNPTFKPRSFFDFGSGVGTGMWAASTLWKDTIFEYFNVDSSRDMNELADLILREGNENQESLLRNVFFRQFLPSTETKYNLVLSSHSLLELPSREARKDVILNLWKKCDGYLIIVEQGTRAGFELVAEARQYILTRKDPALKGHVFSPCTQDFPCPRMTNKSDWTPCNFEISYSTLPVGALSTKNIATYSYVVMKKGKRNLENETNDWPRIVREVMVRKKHTVCRMCTSEGKLQEIIFTASKHGKLAYKCAKSSRWGDRLPIKIGEIIEPTVKGEMPDKNINVVDEGTSGDEIAK